VEAAATSLLQGQPFLVVVLVIAIVFLWRDLQKEREARVNMQRDHINATNAMVVAVDRLTEALKGGRR
jgi:hypothetical protein